ncbi:hypothetical protein ACFL3V_06740 [Nanoarchaeota archaeon]
MELPQYTLRPNTNRMVAPWILKLIGLSMLFYGGIFFNVKYAMGSEIPAVISVFIFFFLIVLVVTQLFIYRVKYGKYSYKFYTNRIDFEGKKTETFIFSNFQQAELKQGLFDKMFNTGSIRLSKEFSIHSISNLTQMKSYLEQLVKYYNYSQDRYKAQQQQISMQKEMQQTQQPTAAAQPAAQPTAAAQQPASTTTAQPATSTPAAGTINPQ